MKTTLRTAPHYFIIDSIGGLNEGYSETTCRRIEDVVAPEYGKAMVEDYIDQWVHNIALYYDETYSIDIKFNHEEGLLGGWHKITPIIPDDTEIEEFHTLFIQVYDGTMLGDGAVVYDQIDDSVQTITHKSTAIRVAEEAISIDVERIKARLLDDKSNMHVEQRKDYTNSLIYSYDSLADVVRNLEYPQHCMIDIDDCCLHFFPTQAMKRMTYNGNNVIITL